MATEQFLHGVEVVEIDTGLRPIETVRASVIGLVGTAPDADEVKFPLNTPVLITGSRQEAAGLGTKGTLPWSIDGIFDQAGAAVVVIRIENAELVENESVTRGATDTDALTETPVETIVSASFGAETYVRDTDFVQDGNNIRWLQAKRTHTETLTRGAGATDALTKTPGVFILSAVQSPVVYLRGKDYKLTGNTIEWLTGGQAPATASTYTVTYQYDAAPVADDVYTVTYKKRLTDNQILSNVIGGINDTTGQYEGVHALLAAQSVVKLTPRILIVPGFSHQAAVVTELLGIADRLRGVIIADGPNTTDADAITYREMWGSPRVYLVDPWVKVWDTALDTEVMQPASARVAGVLNKSDNERGFWWSPSNREIYGILGPARHVDFALGDPYSRANYLNENRVATIIQKDGFRLWGNRTCASDQKWMFLNVRRTADMINESLLQAHMWAVDRNINRTLVVDVLDGVNAYLRHLRAVGAIINGTAWADPDLNTPDQIMQGKLYIDFDFSANYPAEHIIFRSHLTPDYLVEIFQDIQEDLQ